MIRTPLEHRFIETNNVRLHTVFAGPESGPLVICLHGFPEFWWGWYQQIDTLAEAGYRVVLPDQRGYNQSEKPRGITSYGLEILAMDIQGIIQSSGRANAAVIGHDWGAAVAWQLAAQSPHIVSRLGILNVPIPPVMVQTLRSNFRQFLKSWYIFFFQIPFLPEFLLSAQNCAGLASLLIRSGKRNNFPPVILDRYRAAWSQPGALTGMLNWYRAAFRGGLKASSFGVFPADVRITMPTLILWGARDVALSRTMASESLKYCDRGELIFFENATHWVQHDEPDAVNHHLLKFLRE